MQHESRKHTPIHLPFFFRGQFFAKTILSEFNQCAKQNMRVVPELQSQFKKYVSAGKPRGARCRRVVTVGVLNNHQRLVEQLRFLRFSQRFAIEVTDIDE